MNSTVSIIIPVYNLEGYIAKCITSCIDQEYQYIEIIVINDGSTDRSKVVIDEYAAKDNRIIAIHNTNQGVTAARFSGISMATGDYLYFLDGDDTISPNAIRKTLDIARKHNADLIIGSLLKVDAKNKQIGEIKSQLPYGSSSIDVLNAIFTEKCVMGLSGNLIKRSIFTNNKINIPNDIFIGEDVVSMVQVVLNSSTICLANYAGYHYLQRPTSVMHKPSKKAINSRVKLILWLHSFFQNLNISDSNLRDTLSFFMLNNWFAFLKTGGNLDTNKTTANIIYTNYLTNKWAQSNVPLWRIFIIKTYKKSIFLGKVVCRIFTILRAIAKKLFTNTKTT